MRKLRRPRSKYFRTIHNLEVEEIELFIGDIIGVTLADKPTHRLILSLTKNGACVEYDPWNYYGTGTISKLRWFLETSYANETGCTIERLGTVKTHRVTKDGEVVER